MKKYVVGYNMPGYLCDNEPVEFNSFKKAKLCIYEDLMRYLHELYDCGEISDKDFEQHEIEINMLKTMDYPFHYKLGPYIFWATFDPWKS